MYIKDDAGEVTGWFEDYATDDQRYYLGLQGNQSVTNDEGATDVVQRYDDSASDEVYQAWVNATDHGNRESNDISDPQGDYINNPNLYVCVTLGTYIVPDGQLTIIKSAPEGVELDPEQVFIFKIEGTTADGLAFNMSVTTNGEGALTIFNMPRGIYTVTEMTDWSWRYNVSSTTVEVADSSGNYTGTTDTSGSNVTEVTVEGILGSSQCNNPKVTFVNEPGNDKWLDGNSPKVVNSAGATNATSTTVGGQNTGENVAYVNFKREETLI